MIRCAVTVSLAPHSRGEPFIFRDDLGAACAQAAKLGFDAVEIFPASAEDLKAPEVKDLLTRHHLTLAAVGTGAGWVTHRLRLTDPDPVARTRALEFIAALVDFAGGFGAPVIVGSMQGRTEAGVSCDQALGWLRKALEQLGPRAHALQVPLLFEPLNRYETNLVTTLGAGVSLLASLRTRNVKLLADLFHMNLEEASIPNALLAAGPQLGYVHFADSNRQPAGCGHTDFGAVAAALRQIGYDGYLSAEALPVPSSEQAARQTMALFRRFFR